MAHDTATLMTCRKYGIYRADCERHIYPHITLDVGDKFPACPPEERPFEGRGHKVDWELVAECLAGAVPAAIRRARCKRIVIFQNRKN